MQRFVGINREPEGKDYDQSRRYAGADQTNDSKTDIDHPDRRGIYGYRRIYRWNSMWKLLMGMRACGLKNDALMETFYEIIGEHYQADEDYAIYVFHDRYDIPAKGLDHIRQGESERMYEYILCVICPLSGEYEPGEPECGFLFPAFVDGGAAMNYVDIYQEDEEYPHEELLELLGVERKKLWQKHTSQEKK